MLTPKAKQSDHRTSRHFPAGQISEPDPSQGHHTRFLWRTTGQAFISFWSHRQQARSMLGISSAKLCNAVKHLSQASLTGQSSILVNNLPRLCWFGILSWFISHEGGTCATQKKRKKVIWIWKDNRKLEVFQIIFCQRTCVDVNPDTRKIDYVFLIKELWHLSVFRHVTTAALCWL